MKRLLILSGKGGTGKTTVSAALIRLANAKAAADCDVDAPNLHLVFDRETKPETTVFFGGDKALADETKCTGCGVCLTNCRFGALSLKEGKIAVNEYVCEGCGVCAYVCPEKAIGLIRDQAGEEKLYTDEQGVFSTAMLKMGRGNSGKLVTEVKQAMLKAAPPCDLAVIDGSPGIGCPVMASASGADLVLIVAEPSGSGISDLKRLMQTAETFRAKAAVCVNKFDTAPVYTKRIEEFCKERDIPYAGGIPFDPEAVRAVNGGYSIVSVDCPSGNAVKAIYETVLALLR